jgi:hypothetical protein
MQRGFLLEHRKAVRWIGGKPEPTLLGDVKSASNQYQIETYRCIACGYLESYARKPMN